MCTKRFLPKETRTDLPSESNHALIKCMYLTAEYSHVPISQVLHLYRSDKHNTTYRLHKENKQTGTAVGLHFNHVTGSPA